MLRRLILLPLSLLLVLHGSGCGFAKHKSAREEDLAQLAALPKPGRISAADWQQLKDSLREIILAGSARTTSEPPLKPASQSQAAFLPGSGTLTWTYASVGDCDQNSEVNVSDLSPIGSHFHDTNAPDPFPATWSESVIDCDSNGEINISDLSPIGANLHTSVRSYNVYSSSDQGDYPGSPTAASTIAPIGNVSFEAALGDKSVDRLHFEFVVSSPIADSYYWVRPTDGTTEGTPSTLAGGPPPVITVTATACPDDGPPPIQTTITVQTDPPDSNYDYTYDFDLDGDGIYETTDKYTPYDVDIPGSGPHTVNVRVSSPEGGLGTGSINFDGTLRHWLHRRLYVDGTEVLLGKLEVIDGKPMTVVTTVNASYAPDVYVFHSDDAQGDLWNSTLVEHEDIVGARLNVLANRGGLLPGVFYSTFQDQIQYRSGLDASGANFASAVTAATDVGLQGSGIVAGAVINDRPCVAYITTDEKLAFVIASQSDGSAWDAPVILDPNFYSYSGDALRGAILVANNQIQLYVLHNKEDFSPADYVVYKSTDLTGAAWGPAQVLETSIGLEANPSAALIDGNPAYALANQNLEHIGALKYVRATDPGATAWNPYKLIDWDTVLDVALQDVGGAPAVAYCKATGTGEDMVQQMYLAQGQDLDGDAWGTPVMFGCSLPSDLEFYDSISLADLGGRPAVLYGHLNYAGDITFYYDAWLIP